MSSDGVLYSYSDNNCVIKLVGAVKYTTVATDFERFVDSLVDNSDLEEVVIDMRECTYIDSTDLGILARITVSQMQRGKQTPALLYKVDSDIGAILKDVGFDRVFSMVEDHDFDESSLKQLEKDASADELGMATMMLKAHELLIDLDEGNREKFGTVVDFMKKNVDSLSEKGDEQ